MKPLSLEVDSKDTKRVNLPIGRILVSELAALINGPLVNYKKTADNAINELADRAFDDLLHRIHENKEQSVAFVETMREERTTYNMNRAPAVARKRRLIRDNDLLDDEPVAHTNAPPPPPPLRTSLSSNDIELEPIGRAKFDEMIYELQKWFERSDDRGRRIAYNYLRQARRALEQNTATD
jgi:hypothetical protein